MKKIFSVTLIALAFVVGQIAFPVSAEAADSYVGTFRASQAKAYIMTETVKKTGRNTCEATLKAVFPNGAVQHIYYVFDDSDERGRVTFRNSDGNSGIFQYYVFIGRARGVKVERAPVSETYPVEYGMYSFIEKHK